MKTFKGFVDGIETGTFEAEDYDHAMHKMAEWGGCSVEEIKVQLKWDGESRVKCWDCGKELDSNEIRSNEGLDAEHEDEWYCDDCVPKEEDVE